MKKVLTKRFAKFLVRYGRMNSTFRTLRMVERFYLALAAFGIIPLIASTLKLLSFLSRAPCELRWLFILIVSVAVFLISIVASIDTEIAMLRRELWFVEHRLGLPKVEEELEDVEAYEEWLEEYLERKARTKGGGESG